MIRRLVLAAAVAALGACGLIDPDITHFDLSMPQRTFTVDSEQWGLSGDQSLDSIDCTGMPDICSAAIDAYCTGSECTGRCADSGTCELEVRVSLYHTINLYDEKPELQTLDDQPLVDVTIERIYYSITENTFNRRSPQITVYVAPQSVMAPDDDQARAVGTIAPVQAGQKVESADVDLTPEGRDILREFMSDYRTPFNIIVGARIDIAGGDEMPSGRIVADVSVDAFAGL